MGRSQVIVAVSLSVLAIAGSQLLRIGRCGAAEPEVFRVESINDTEIGENPVPPPVHEVEYTFDVTASPHVETVAVSSTHLRNLSITLENRGRKTIRSPHVLGPHGWDFRSLEAIAAAATADPGLTNMEKFVRVHEWKGMHVKTVLGKSEEPYRNGDFSGNPLRILNQYGHCMCVSSVNTINGLLRVVPPVGTMYGRKANLNAHRMGEVFFDGAWHAFDTHVGTGSVQWIYYDYDNRTLAPTWKYLIDHPDLVTRVKDWTGFNLASSLPGATGDTLSTNVDYTFWDFNHDLSPDERVTFHFDMRGRLDRVSNRQDNSVLYRAYSDYGSAVFTYEPDLTRGEYRERIVEESNVSFAPGQIVPIDPTRPAHVVFEARSTWCFAGAEIAAGFKTTGEVYMAVNSDPYDVEYHSNMSWQRLSSSVQEYPAGVEGKMAYWIKLVFRGPGSGLEHLRMDSEVQVSPWSMPGLEYGVNRIRCVASDLAGSTLRVTYRHDDISPFHTYEPATSRHGRHVPIRVGGVLEQGAKLSSPDDYRKARYWQRIARDPTGTVPVLVEILAVSGDQSGRVVRRLVDRSLRYGWYKFYWDGMDDSGASLPAGMYCYRFSIDGVTIHGERLYLYREIWPIPNELSSGPDPEPPPDPPPAGLVIDNGEAGTSSTGSWYRSAGADPYGEDSLYSRNGATYAYTFAVPGAGRYSVRLWWTEYPTRSRRVPVDIQHADGTSRVYVDQQQNGGRWNDLGAFSFGATAVVRILADGASTTCADAASLEPDASVREDVVIDDGDAGTSFTGTWRLSGGAGTHGETSLYARSGPTYTYTGAATGMYRVYAWWTEYAGRSASVPIAIRHAGGVSTVRVSQRAGGGQWNLLGEWTFDGEAQITIIAEGTDTTCADALRLEPSS